MTVLYECIIRKDCMFVVILLLFPGKYKTFIQSLNILKIKIST